MDKEHAATIPDRLPFLSFGAHESDSSDMCAMEAAAWLAGEPWTDRPRAVHPSIAAVARWVNDSIDDRRRQELWPLIVASLGTDRRRQPVLGFRLAVFAGAAKRRAIAAGNPVQAWTELLARHSRLCGSGSLELLEFAGYTAPGGKLTSPTA